MKRYLIYLLLISLCPYVRAQNFFTIQGTSNATGQAVVNATYSETTIITPFPDGIHISGLSITGNVATQSKNYLVRVILKDNDEHEYCVLESYKEINDDSLFVFTDYCEETALLDNVTPTSLKVIVKNAVVTLSKVSWVSASNNMMQMSTQTTASTEEIKKAQISSTIEKINNYNRDHYRLWVAGETALSQMSYEERMRVLNCPEDVSTGGYEYYVDGFFVVGDISETTAQTSTSNYVSKFDWRNRHGKNWVTPVKDQGSSNYCFAFASVACLESMYMLYYNDNTTIDLSEQEAACCTHSVGTDTYTDGGYVDSVLTYMQYNGISDEQAYPLDITSRKPCQSGYIFPSEQVTISGRALLIDDQYDDSIKHWLINYGPLISGRYWYNHIEDKDKYRNGHAMELVGYNTISHDDLIRIHYRYKLGDILVAPEKYVGKTYWIFKNSYGTNNDTYTGGYQYIIFEDSSSYRHNWYMDPVRRIEAPIYSTIKTEQDIICEDADGDGYYFWGIGPKPANCPSWVPDEPDGDDSDYNYGPMDSYGHLDYLPDYISQAVVISSSVTYSTPRYNYGVTVITPNGTLTVKDKLTLYGDVAITMQQGSKLIVDGGNIENAKFTIQNGCSVILKNGGKINMANGKEFSVPEGATMEISEGMIKQF